MTSNYSNAHFVLKVDGSAQDDIPDQDIISIEIQQFINKHGEAIISLFHDDPTNPTYYNDGRFEIGSEVEIEFSADDETGKVYKGIIYKLGTSIFKGKVTTSIYLSTSTLKLEQAVHNRVHPDSKSMVTALLDEYGLEYDNSNSLGDDSNTRSILQHQQSDWDFLLTRMKSLGLMLLPRNESLVLADFASLEDAPEEIHIDDINRCNIFLDGNFAVSDIQMTTFDHEGDEMLRETAESANDTIGNVSTDDLSGTLENNPIVFSNYNRSSIEEQKAFCDAMVSHNIHDKVKGYILLDASPSFECGQLVNLEELGQSVAGKALIKGVRHIIKNTWTTELNFGGPYDDIKFQESQSFTPYPAIRGLHNGLVVEVGYTGGDGGEKDPYMVQVYLPTLMEDDAESQADKLIWARLSSFYAGSARGFLCMPEVGDEVVVGFIGESADNPVILGSLFKNASEHPLIEDSSGYDSPDYDGSVKSFTSLNGMQFIFNDLEKSISIITASSEIHLLEEDEEVQITDIHNNSILMNADGFSFTTDGAFNVEAADIELKTSSGDVVVSATGNANVEGRAIALASQSTLDCEGMSTTVKSDGITTIKGSLIQLN